LHPENVVELDRCRYNTQVYDDGTNCPGCDDCRYTPVEEIQSIHFTLCGKPWACIQNDQQPEVNHLCVQTHALWFQQRREWELKSGLTPPILKNNIQHNGSRTFNYALGYCRGDGDYIPIAFPAEN
jgi:lipopolysaccharide biosynthesis glycosyltransferase